jgi:hypothetical protein
MRAPTPTGYLASSDRPSCRIGALLLRNTAPTNFYATTFFTCLSLSLFHRCCCMVAPFVALLPLERLRRRSATCCMDGSILFGPLPSSRRCVSCASWVRTRIIRGVAAVTTAMLSQLRVHGSVDISDLTDEWTNECNVLMCSNCQTRPEHMAL